MCWPGDGNGGARSIASSPTRPAVGCGPTPGRALNPNPQGRVEMAAVVGVAGREEGVVDEVKNFMAGIGRALRADLKATLPASFLR